MGGASCFPSHPSSSLCLQGTKEPALPGARARDGPRPLRGATLFPTAGPDPQAREPPACVHLGWKSPRTQQADWGREVDTEGW